MVTRDGFGNCFRQKILTLFGAHKFFFFGVGQETGLNQNGRHGGSVQDQKSSLFDSAAMPACFTNKLFLDQLGELQTLASVGALKKFEDDVGGRVVGVEAIVFGQVIAFQKDRRVFAFGYMEVGAGNMKTLGKGLGSIGLASSAVAMDRNK